MNKKHITEFSIYLQAFMRRIVTRFQIPGIFLMMKRWKWWKNFQSLFQQKLKVTDFSHQIGPFSKWRKTNGLLWCWWWNKRSIHQRSVFSPEICCQVLSEAFTETFVVFLLARWIAFALERFLWFIIFCYIVK